MKLFRGPAACLLALTAATAVAAPAPGRYDGELCVALSAAAPNCGEAELRLDRKGAARVRIDDMVYRLQLRSDQVEVVLMHGAVQIDEFTAPYAWAGNSLTFADADKEARYELRFARLRR